MLCISFVLCICAFVYYRPHAHPFWKNQPVAWTQLLPTTEGIIQPIADSRQLATTPHGYSPLSTQFKIRILDVGLPYDALSGSGNIHASPKHALVSSDELVQTAEIKKGGPDGSSSLWNQLGNLWNVTPLFAQWKCLVPGTKLVVLVDRSKPIQHDRVGTIVGTIMICPLTLHTPIHEHLPAYTVNYLTLHEDYRHQGLTPHLLQTSFTMVSQHGKPGIALFTKQLDPTTPSMGRLPFAPVARLVRSQRVFSPSMLPDPPMELQHQVVRSVDKLPRTCFEVSQIRIQGIATLEPSPESATRRAHWNYVIANPLHTLLAVEGTEWIHMHYMTRNTICVRGSSYQESEYDKMAAHVLAYLKKTMADKNVHITLVIPDSCKKGFSEKALSTAAVSGAPNEWQLYDVHDLHMYNYRLNSRNLYVPFHLDVDIL